MAKVDIDFFSPCFLPGGGAERAGFLPPLAAGDDEHSRSYG